MSEVEINKKEKEINEESKCVAMRLVEIIEIQSCR